MGQLIKPRDQKQAPTRRVRNTSLFCNVKIWQGMVLLSTLRVFRVDSDIH